jgi:hypothetical protein
MNDIQNPFLDDTEDEVVVPATTKGDGRPGSEFWGRPKSPEKIAADKKLRAAGIVPDGQKAKSGLRRDYNEKDFRVFLLMLSLRWVTVEMVAAVLEVERETAAGRLRGLRKTGMVGSHKFTNCNMTWFVKQKAVALMAEEGIELPDFYTLVDPNRISEDKFGHKIAVNHVAVHLLTGGTTMTRWDDSLPLERLVTERVMQRHFKNAFRTDDCVYGAGTLSERAKAEVATRLRNGDLKVTDMLREYPMLWVPTTKSNSVVPAMQYSSPDLVIDKEDLRADGKRRSIAIEVELTAKGVAEYMKIMETYRQNTLVYCGVAWFVANDKIRARVEQAAAAVGFPMKQLSICTLIGKDGLPYHGSSSF